MLSFSFSIPRPITCFHSMTKNFTSLCSVSVLQSQGPLHISNGLQTPQFIQTFHAETTHQIHVGEFFWRACRSLLVWHVVECSLPLQYAHHLFPMEHPKCFPVEHITSQWAYQWFPIDQKFIIPSPMETFKKHLILCCSLPLWYAHHQFTMDHPTYFPVEHTNKPHLA